MWPYCWLADRDPTRRIGVRTACEVRQEAQAPMQDADLCGAGGGARPLLWGALATRRDEAANQIGQA